MDNRKQRLKHSVVYIWAQRITNLMDRYYIDGVVGAIPGGMGDVLTALFALVHIYFSLFKLRSVPLTLALLTNTLRDVLLGMIPFYVGDIIDFFHKSNIRNMQLIDGYINDDPLVVRTVKERMWWSLVVVIAMVTAIGMMISLLVWLTAKIGSIIFC